MKKITLIALPFTAGLLLLAAPGTAQAAPVSHPLSVSPSSNLTNGQVTTVSSSGWPAATTVFVLECGDTSGAGTCDTGHLVSVTTDAAGAFSTPFTVRTGAIGSMTCNAGSTCYIAAGTANQSDAGALPIHFKAAAVASPTTAPVATPTSAAPASGGATPAATAAPVTVSAGSGGTADHSSLPLVPAAVGVIGLVLAGAGVRRLRR